MGDEGLNPEGAMMAELDARLVRALESRPAVTIPAGFAARVTRQLPERRPVSLTPRYYGRNAVVIGMIVLAVALLGLALRNAEHTALELTLEWIICAQLILLAVWFGGWRRSLR